MNYANVSILMSVYYKEDARYFKESLESVIQQTMIPRQIVIVRDGNLTKSLDNVLDNFIETYGYLIEISVIQLQQQKGLGIALNFGLQSCKYDLVARMDSDDHAMENRFEKQIKYLGTHPDIKVLGGQIQEFVNQWNQPFRLRNVPTSSISILKFSRYRNPLNHMTVMFDKRFILDVLDGYHDVPGFEDYELWLRVLKADQSALGNLADILVAARVSNLQERRGGLNYIRQNYLARQTFLRNDLITFKDFVVTVTAGILVSLTPSKLRAAIYKYILRRDYME